MAKKKLTAKQQRMRRERERAERAAYQAGQIKPAPKKPAKQRATSEAKKTKRAVSEARRRTAAETAAMTNAAVIGDIMRLWDAAYSKYRRLMAQGTPNLATSIYEQNFAGMDPTQNNVNKNRALATALRKWLKRKDVSATKAKKQKKKTERMFEKSFGYDKMTDEEKRAFWDSYKKFVEYSGGVPQGAKHYVKHFSNAYKVYRDNPGMSQQQLFESARERMMKEYEQSLSVDTFGQNPLDI